MAVMEVPKTQLSPSQFFWMLCMPLSQIVGYVLVLGPLLVPVTSQVPTQLGPQANSPPAFPSFGQVLTGLTFFHTVWALKNRLLENPNEAGFLAFGTSAIGFTIGLESVAGQVMAVMGVFAASVAFAVDGFTRVLLWPAEKLAYKAKKTLLWAHVTRVFYISSLVFLPLVLMRLVVLLLHYRSLVQIHQAYVYGGEVKMKDGSMERLPGLHPLHNEL